MFTAASGLHGQVFRACGCSLPLWLVTSSASIQIKSTNLARFSDCHWKIVSNILPKLNQLVTVITVFSIPFDLQNSHVFFGQSRPCCHQFNNSLLNVLSKMVVKYLKLYCKIYLAWIYMKYKYISGNFEAKQEQTKGYWRNRRILNRAYCTQAIKT